MEQKQTRSYKAFIGLMMTAVLLPVFSGCGDFFAEKATEIEAAAILEELGQVRESPYTQNPVPEAYRQPTQRLAIKDGIKVFYFAKHHPVSELSSLVAQQMGVTSTINSATNQVVAFCADDSQANAVELYLDMIDVPPVQVNVDCLILERFGDITMDWETSILVENLLGEGITLGEARGTYNNQGVLVDLDPAFPGASLREAERAKFGMDFGYWIDKGVPGHQVRAVVDVLVSRGYLKILLNPQLETINGKRASVTIKDYAPIEEVRTGSAGASSVYNITTYVWVENTLAVTPHVYSDGSIGLVTDIKISSRSKPEGVVQRAIITERSINVQENRIEPGKSLIIGGMRKSEKRSVVRGIPFLKDLPLLGILFSSKDFEEKGTEIVFILTPSVSSGGVDNRRMVRKIRRQYEEPEYRRGMTADMIRPFSDPYTGVLERKATDAELERIQAEMDLEQAQLQAKTEKERADRAVEQAKKLRLQAQELQQKAQAAQKEAQEASERAAALASQTQAEKEKAAQLAQQKQQALEAAQAAQQAAQAAAVEAEQAAQDAQQIQQQALDAQVQLEAVRKAAEEAQRQAAEEEAKRQAQEAALQEAETQPIPVENVQYEPGPDPESSATPQGPVPSTP
jgi:Flp pilus assembly secretin CpaC